jgi:hypothetical protein
LAGQLVKIKRLEIEMYILKFAATIIAFVLSTSSQAALVERMGGRADYNEIAHLTWPTDTNHKKSRGYANDEHVNRDATNNWALQWDVSGVTGWHLADTDSPCADAYCSKREAGTLFHNKPDASRGNNNPSRHNTKHDLFSHKDSRYWSDSWHTNRPDDTPYAEYYRGGQGHSGKTYHFDKCEVSAVPVPAAVWLFGSGLICLIGIGRRKTHA